MGERMQVNFRVDEEQKDDWERYIDQTGKYSSLTGLIRTAVEKEINDDQTATPTESPAISADLQDLQDDIDRIQKDVRWLRDQRQQRVDISELAQEVYDHLEPLPKPTAENEVPSSAEMDPKEYRRKEAARTVILPSDSGKADDSRINWQTPGRIADRIDSTESYVQDAIEHLQDQLLPIVEVEVDGRSHFFKEE
ncbi:hypothetical protein GRS48_06515 [Halorubrum sp. JWXQ-INN 858]|uniref:hypothetical protein n=1 Tax=Halorubrum sp. JWXQ-INN 858 TaxID=2690782 RepID=UPI0013567CC7|nr:hypothetical protein [Halorubrum sp. JWXQ-INN 858]MWV64477.1 hypothetical protein [Halorubrum sp. JWXQ-INN 858]